MSVKVVVIGANGLLGRSFINHLSKHSTLFVEPRKSIPISNVVLIDQNLDFYEENPITSESIKWNNRKCDLCDTESMKEAIEPSPNDEQVMVFLFAAVLSGNAESNFDLGMKVNLQGPISLLNVMRKIGERLGYPIKFVYTSSDYVACFNEENRNRPFSEEGFRLSPTSYGVQKACMELLICDYARRGFVDGRVGRVSAMIGRPGFSNSISSAFSMIFTQTLIGNDYQVPLPMESILPCSSLENNVECLLLLGGKISGEELGHNRVVQLPAASYTLKEIWDATQTVAECHDIKIGSISHINSDEASTTFTHLNVCPRVDSTLSERLGMPQDIGLTSIINNFMKREKLIN